MNAVMPVIVRTSDTPYRCGVDAIADQDPNHEKKVPADFIRKDGQIAALAGLSLPQESFPRLTVPVNLVTLCAPLAEAGEIFSRHQPTSTRWPAHGFG